MQNTELEQKIIICGKKRIDIDQVVGVSSLDDEVALVDTDSGSIVIEGGLLKLENLDKTERRVSFIGEIYGVYYLEKTNKKKGRSVFK